MPTRDVLEAECGQMMAFVDNQVPVVGHESSRTTPFRTRL